MRLYSVDRSWNNVPTNLDGEIYPSAVTKLHLDRGDTTAKCSKRILLNNLPQDAEGITLNDAVATMPGAICRRCVPSLTAARVLFRPTREEKQ